VRENQGRRVDSWKPEGLFNKITVQRDIRLSWPSDRRSTARNRSAGERMDAGAHWPVGQGGQRPRHGGGLTGQAWSRGTSDRRSVRTQGARAWSGIAGAGQKRRGRLDKLTDGALTMRPGSEKVERWRKDSRWVGATPVRNRGRGEGGLRRARAWTSFSKARGTSRTDAGALDRTNSAGHRVGTTDCDGTSQVIRPTYSCSCPTDLRQSCRCPWITWQVRYLLFLPFPKAFHPSRRHYKHRRYENAEAITLNYLYWKVRQSYNITD
jgi:hypothetical protein